jgi:thioredoxin reductase (NADPH)
VLTVVFTCSGEETLAADICTYDGKLKLIVTGVAEAATAANFAKTTIDPNAKTFPGHSSDMK